MINEIHFWQHSIKKQFEIEDNLKKEYTEIKMNYTKIDINFAKIKFQNSNQVNENSNTKILIGNETENLLKITSSFKDEILKLENEKKALIVSKYDLSRIITSVKNANDVSETLKTKQKENLLSLQNLTKITSEFKSQVNLFRMSIQLNKSLILNLIKVHILMKNN